MARRQLAAVAASLLIALSFGSTKSQAHERKPTATVIVACDHGGRAEFATRVSGVETAGGASDRLAAAVQAQSSCAEAFNLLARAGFEQVHRLVGAQGDFDGDGDVDGRDFLVWQRGNSPAPARPSARVATVLLKCDYVVADGLVTRVAGSESAGAIAERLAAALATGPSCAEAYALLAGAGFGLVSAEPSPAASGASASNLSDWRSNYGVGP